MFSDREMPMIWANYLVIGQHATGWCWQCHTPFIVPSRIERKQVDLGEVAALSDWYIMSICAELGPRFARIGETRPARRRGVRPDWSPVHRVTPAFLSR